MGCSEGVGSYNAQPQPGLRQSFPTCLYWKFKGGGVPLRNRGGSMLFLVADHLKKQLIKESALNLLSTCPPVPMCLCSISLLGILQPHTQLDFFVLMFFVGFFDVKWFFCVSFFFFPFFKLQGLKLIHLKDNIN